MSGPLSFLASNTHLAIRNPKFRIEIDPKCSKDLFFGLHLNLGAKVGTEIEVLSKTKLCKNILPMGICLINKKSTPMLRHISTFWSRVKKLECPFNVIFLCLIDLRL